MPRAARRGADVTAIVAGNDLMALGCYDVLAERGLRCPADVSVVGFNDMPFADRFHPPLTTVRIPHREMGAAAADLLLELLAHPADAAAPARSCRCALEVRGSTAPCAPRALPLVRPLGRAVCASTSSAVLRLDSTSRSSGSSPPTV